MVVHSRRGEGGELWLQPNSKQVLTPALPAATRPLSEPLKPTQDEWRFILNPPSAPGPGPTYSSAASFSHFCLRGDVRSYSNKTPAAVSAKRVIHTSQIPVRVSLGLKSRFSGVTRQLTSNFRCEDTGSKIHTRYKSQILYQQKQEQDKCRGAGSLGN